MSYQATLRGLTIGDGTDFEWETAPEGLGLPQFETSRVQRVAVDGRRPMGPDLLGSRMVTFNVEIWAGPGGTVLVESLMDELKQAWAPVRSGTIPLTFDLEGGERLLVGRPAACDIDLSALIYAKSHGRARLVFEATDPRLYAETLSSVVLGLTVGGGMVFPLTFPLTFGAGSDSDGVAVNEGNTDAPWTATIVGPVTTPRITLGATGEFLELDGVVPSGSTLVVDSATQSILLDGSPRQSWQTLLSRWWSLAPGSNTVRYRASSGTGSCTFSWRSAWL